MEDDSATTDAVAELLAFYGEDDDQDGASDGLGWLTDLMSGAADDADDATESEGNEEDALTTSADTLTDASVGKHTPTPDTTENEPSDGDAEDDEWAFDGDTTLSDIMEGKSVAAPELSMTDVMTGEEEEKEEEDGAKQQEPQHQPVLVQQDQPAQTTNSQAPSDETSKPTPRANQEHPSPFARSRFMKYRHQNSFHRSLRKSLRKRQSQRSKRATATSDAPPVTTTELDAADGIAEVLLVLADGEQQQRAVSQDAKDEEVTPEETSSFSRRVNASIRKSRLNRSRRRNHAQDAATNDGGGDRTTIGTGSPLPTIMDTEDGVDGDSSVDTNGKEASTRRSRSSNVLSLSTRRQGSSTTTTTAAANMPSQSDQHEAARNVAAIGVTNNSGKDNGDEADIPRESTKGIRRSSGVLTSFQRPKLTKRESIESAILTQQTSHGPSLGKESQAMLIKQLSEDLYVSRNRRASVSKAATVTSTKFIVGELMKLVDAIKKNGRTNKDTGVVSISFGVLYDRSAELFKGGDLSSVLNVARNQALVSFQGSFLYVGVDDFVTIRLISEDIPTDPAAYTLRQLRQVSIRKKRRGSNSGPVSTSHSRPDTSALAQPSPTHAPELVDFEDKKLSSCVQSGQLSVEGANAAVKWVDKQMRQLVEAFVRYGRENRSGRVVATFGVIYDKTADKLEASELGALLSTAREQGIVSYAGDDLKVVRDDFVKITLLNANVSDSTAESYTFQQIRRLSMRKRRSVKRSMKRSTRRVRQPHNH